MNHRLIFKGVTPFHHPPTLSLIVQVEIHAVIGTEYIAVTRAIVRRLLVPRYLPNDAMMVRGYMASIHSIMVFSIPNTYDLH